MVIRVELANFPPAQSSSTTANPAASSAAHSAAGSSVCSLARPLGGLLGGLEQLFSDQPTEAGLQCADHRLGHPEPGERKGQVTDRVTHLLSEVCASVKTRSTSSVRYLSLIPAKRNSARR